MAVLDKNEYAKWLTFQIDHNGKYHQHKETMAWVATALYLPGVITIGYYVGRGQWNLGTQVFISLLLLVVVYLVFVFVNMQFDMRWYAGDVVEILCRRMVKLNGGVEQAPAPDEWTIRNEDKDFWPKFVQEEVDKLKERRDLKAALRDIFLFRLDKVDDRWKTEIPSYVAIILATVAAFILMWCPLP